MDSESLAAPRGRKNALISASCKISGVFLQALSLSRELSASNDRLFRRSVPNKHAPDKGLAKLSWRKIAVSLIERATSVLIAQAFTTGDSFSLSKSSQKLCIRCSP